MIRLSLAAIAALLALVIQPLNAADRTPAQTALDAKVPGWLKQYKVPSVSIAYVENGALAWTATYGEQSPGVPATAETLYNVASMTKPITAEVVLRLASQDKLSLDESMSSAWIDPDIKNDPRHVLLTPRIALTHRTGFANWRRMTDGVLKFQFTPGAKSQYAGEGYEYLARFAQNRMGRPFDALAQDLIFTPLGMTNTSYVQRDWFKGRIALPHDRDGKAGEPGLTDKVIASDMLRTTASDYAKFMVSVMNGDAVAPRLAAQRFDLRENEAAGFCKEAKFAADICPARLGYGLGWAIYGYPSETIVMHGGSDDGVKTLGFYVPERRTGVVIFTNGENGQKIIRDVAGELYDNRGFIAFLALQAGG